MPHLEDEARACEHDVVCAKCEHDAEVEGTHYLDSESFQWQCPICLHTKSVPLASCVDAIDPDEVHDRIKEEALVFSMNWPLDD